MTDTIRMTRAAFDRLRQSYEGEDVMPTFAWAGHSSMLDVTPEGKWQLKEQDDLEHRVEQIFSRLLDLESSVINSNIRRAGTDHDEGYRLDRLENEMTALKVWIQQRKEGAETLDEFLKAMIEVLQEESSKTDTPTTNRLVVTLLELVGKSNDRVKQVERGLTSLHEQMNRSVPKHTHTPNEVVLGHENEIAQLRAEVAALRQQADAIDTIPMPIGVNSVSVVDGVLRFYVGDGDERRNWYGFRIIEMLQQQNPTAIFGRDALEDADGE